MARWSGLCHASYEELTSVPEIGERIAESVVQYFAVAKNKELIDRLIAYGLKTEVEKHEEIDGNGILDGKTFVISGVFSRISREALADLIKKQGGKVLSSISAKLDFLVAGENMGPSKKEKAENLNIRIISESDFFDMIGQ
ncbi:MAG: BRCT domain-containing protein [Cyclobacteriaceae bacterium]|nr:BRCT domain-containing protein [Cyclobacteriaceae bacterium]